MSDETTKRFAEGVHKLAVEALPKGSQEEVLAMLVGAAYGYARKLGLSRLAFYKKVHAWLGRLQEGADA